MEHGCKSRRACVKVVVTDLALSSTMLAIMAIIASAECPPAWPPTENCDDSSADLTCIRVAICWAMCAAQGAM